MLFWTLFAMMTGAAIFAVLWPLGRARAPVAAAEADLAVYRDQLAEIDRDRARGLIADAEAESARIEVSRRLLAASASGAESEVTGSQTRRRAAALIALVLVPSLALGGYALVGTPGLPDAPLQARLDRAPEQQDIAILVRRIETHLANNPSDARGWELLAPIYVRLGRAQDAVNARANVLRIAGSSAEREADLGEALVMAADGIVNEDARAAFERALEHEPENAKARFFIALAAEQDGRREEAFAVWKVLAEESASSKPGEDAWRLAAARRVERMQAGQETQ